MADKKFFGNVKEITNDYGTMFNIGVTKSDVEKLEYNDKGWANLSLKKGKSGNWYIEIFQGNNKGQQNNQQTQENDVNEEELPF